jgi:putative ATP-grasp target RiPP
MTVKLHENATGATMFSSSDHFPLGRAYGRVDATSGPASGVRPFGLTLAVPPPTSIRVDPAELGYDDICQIRLIRDGGGMVPLSRHTDGQTNTQTNTDGHGGYDSDTDYREDDR